MKCKVSGGSCGIPYREKLVSALSKVVIEWADPENEDKCAFTLAVAGDGWTKQCIGFDLNSIEDKTCELYITG